LAKHKKNEAWIDLEKQVKKALGSIDESTLGKCEKNIHDYDVIIFHVNTIMSNLNIDNFLGSVIDETIKFLTEKFSYPAEIFQINVKRDISMWYNTSCR
jgi:hypothetical protein